MPTSCTNSLIGKETQHESQKKYGKIFNKHALDDDGGNGGVHQISRYLGCNASQTIEKKQQAISMENSETFQLPYFLPISCAFIR